MDNFQENFYDATKRQLNLSHRNMRSLDVAVVETFSQCTEYLDLSHNFIHNLTWIYEFPHLRSLIMDNNRLREAHFGNLKRPLPNIHTLMLNKNEMSDLKTTANILNRLFPKVEYLSLHGNAMCPDNLLLQPFCEFVPYEYNHYRTVLIKSLPDLKFLDHFSLDSLHFKPQSSIQINEQPQQHPRQHKPLLTSTFKDLWSKVKSILTVSLNQTSADFPSNSSCEYSSNENSYSGIHSEGNLFIKNSDL